MKKICLMAILVFLFMIIGTGCSQKKVSEKFNGKGYMEDDIELPFDQDREKAISFVKVKKSQMYLYSREKESGDYHIYELLKDHSWKKKSESGLTEFFKNVTYEPRIIESGLDGNIYMLYFDDDYLPHIAKQQGNTIEEVFIADLKKDGSEQQPVYPNGIKSLEDGRIIISYNSEKGAVLYDRQGKKIRRFDKWELGVNVTKNIGVCPELFLSVNDTGTGFCLYDIETWEKKNEIKVGELAGRSYLKEGGGQDFFFLNDEGIHHIMADGSIVETIIEGDEMPALKLDQETVSFEIGDNNSFYVMFQKSGNASLKYYNYDKKQRKEDPTILKMAGLAKSNTIQQAITEFEKKNPDVKIEYQDYGETKDRTTLSDTIRIINTEVLAGEKGPDLIILDGLPADAYAAKGALLDLSVIADEMEGELGLLDNLSLQKDNKGRIFSISSRFGVPLLIGNEDAIRQMESLDSLEKYLNRTDADQIIESDIYEKIAQNIFYMYYNDLKAASFGEQDLEQYINVVMKLVRKTGAKSREEGREEDKNMFRLGFPSNTGKYRVAIEEMKSVMDLSLPVTFQGKYEAQVKTIKSLYTPYDMVGIHAASEHMDEAKEFIRTLLSKKMQSLELGEGFPVIRQTFQDLKPVESDVEAMVEGDEEDQIITFKQADEAELEEFKKIAVELKHPLIVDTIIEELMMDQMNRVYAGSASSSVAARELASKIRLYRSE